MNGTIEVLKSHRSIRRYQERAIDESIVTTILEAAQCAPSSNFVQAYTIIRVEDEAKRKALAQLSGGQVWVEKAPLFLVFCADVNRLEQACETCGHKMVKGHAEQFVVATVDTALVAQNAMIAAESLGLGGVYIGGIRNDPQKVCDLLEIPGNAYPVFGMCLGYPDDDPPVKPRLPLEALLRVDHYERRRDEALIFSYDQTVRDYYLSRKENPKDQTWSRMVSDFVTRVVRPHMKSFLNGQGFFLK